jgi:hypothetical protein
MNETGTAARAWMNPTETEQRAETQILRPSFRLISGLENTGALNVPEPIETVGHGWQLREDCDERERRLPCYLSPCVV